jgi:hypothetical protein
MDSNIQQELILLMNIDKTVDANEQIKVLKICSDILGHQEYTNNIIGIFGGIFNQPDFNISSEFGKIILCILEFNKEVSYYKNIEISRMKYIIYAVLYAYMLKYQVEWINKQNIGDIRILYSNSWELIQIIPETVKIAKIDCLGCIGKRCKWFSFLSGGKIAI